MQKRLSCRLLQLPGVHAVNTTSAQAANVMLAHNCLYDSKATSSQPEHAPD